MYMYVYAYAYMYIYVHTHLCIQLKIAWKDVNYSFFEFQRMRVIINCGNEVKE